MRRAQHEATRCASQAYVTLWDYSACVRSVGRALQLLALDIVVYALQESFGTQPHT
jgi:hypothetical protein